MRRCPFVLGRFGEGPADLMFQFNKSVSFDARVTAMPDNVVPHRVIVRVMDACAKARIESVNFALSEEL